MVAIGILSGRRGAAIVAAVRAGPVVCTATIQSPPLIPTPTAGRRTGGTAEARVNTLLNTFFKGLLAFLPIFLTVYAVYAFGVWLNRMSSRFIAWLGPGVPDVPGIGIAIGFAAIFLLGVLVSSRMTRWIYNLAETPLRHLPVVKDLYAALKQLTVLLARDAEDDTGQVVSVRHPDLDATMIGIVTRSDVESLDDALAASGSVAVYLPMSYQIGGFTLFVPREWVTPVDMSVEVAMRNALTGWTKDRPDAAGS